MLYNVGMYGGTFNPLHLGHVDCMMQAISLCRELYIVLSVGNNRNEIDAKVRYRWLYQLTRYMDNVHLIMLEDNAESKEAYTEKYWNADADIVKKLIGNPIDVVFCGSDYDENSFWNRCYPDSELYIFPRNEISSTEIRHNPYLHWDWIPNIVRPYYVKKILLMGSESTGKSSLTVHLANHFNTNYIDEAGRELSERSGTDTMMLSEDFTEILLQHKINEINALQYSNRVLFIDTDALVTQFYMGFLHDPCIDKNRALSDAIDALNTYDLILFLEPDVDFVQDGDRSEIIRDDRIQYSEQIKTILRNHGREFVSVSGDYWQRYKTAVGLVNRLLGI